MRTLQPVIPLSGIHHKENISNKCKYLVTSILFSSWKAGKQSRYPMIGDLDMLLYIHAPDYYAAFKNDILDVHRMMWKCDTMYYSKKKADNQTAYSTIPFLNIHMCFKKKHGKEMHHSVNNDHLWIVVGVKILHI